MRVLALAGGEKRVRFVRVLKERLALRSLQPISREVLRDNLTYLSTEKLRRIERAVQSTRLVPGDIVEFGVALGGSAIIMATSKGASRRFIGFDVFSMIPPPTSEKDDAHSLERYEIIKSGQSTGIGGDEYYGYRSDLLSDVKQAFERHRVPVDGKDIRLVEGLFEETWKPANVGVISLAHIDCDWYDPVKFCLNAICEKLNPGGIIVLDDYHDYGGCRTAVDEFREVRTDFEFQDGANPYLTKL